MRTWFLLAVLLAPPAWCATYSVTASQSASAIQTVINGAVPGDTVQFAAGTYNVSQAWTLKCGVTYTGPVATPATAILNATFPRESNNIMNLYPASGYAVPCSATTTIAYFQFENTGGIYVQLSFSNLVIRHNQFSNLPCCNAQLHDTGIYLDGSQSGANNTQQVLNTADIEYNTVGDTNSCEGPTTGQLESNTDVAQNCTGLIVQGTVNGPLTISNNTFYHTADGIHFLCVANGQGSECEPPAGVTTKNVTVQYNDFSHLQRIGFEEQPQAVQNILFQYNSYHDAYHPMEGTFDLSFACCNNGSAANQPVVTDNVLIANVTAASSTYVGYGIEAWGNGGYYNYNLVEGQNDAPFITYGKSNSAIEVENDTICGPVGAYLQAEYSGQPTPIQSGNVTARSCSAIASQAPSISPAAGAYAAPLTVTLTDAGFSSGAHPRGNTSIYYTTDGTTPVPGSGTTKLYSTPLTVTPPVTVNAVGMWGSGANPLSYPSGYGFVPSSTVSQSYTLTNVAGVTLQSVTITATGGATTVNLGQQLQMTATCNYSGGITTGCNSTDAYGNAVTTWTSSSANATISSSGLLTGQALGTASIQATVTGGSASNVYGVTVTSAAVTLTSLTLSSAGGVSSIVAGTTNQLIATCGYSDGSTDACGSADAHGNVATAWASSATATGTVSASGLFTGVAAGSANVTAGASPTPSTALGNNTFATASTTNTGTISYDYGVTGPSPGNWAVGTCNSYLPSGSYTAGGFYDCIVTLAPTPTTQTANALCSGRYTIPSGFSGGAWVSVAMSSCPALAPGTAYWVGQATNQSPNGLRGYSVCGSGCNGAAPTQGSGTYGYYYLSGNAFGHYTGMATALSSGGQSQDSIYLNLTTTAVNSAPLTLTVTAAPPTLSSAYLAASAGSVVTGATLQMAAHCVYTNPSTTTDCTVADIYGNAVSSWASSDTTKATISTSGLVTGVAAGATNLSAVINGGIASSNYPLTVTAPAVTLTGLSLATTNGVTGLFVGSTNRLVATCSYSDGSTTNCTSSDAHGNVAGSYTSSAPAFATVNATSGVVTAVAPGTATFGATAGGVSSSPALPLTVLPMPSGVYSIVISGPVSFSGRVQF